MTHTTLITPWRLLAAVALALPLAVQAQLLPSWTSSQAGITTPQLAVDATHAAWVVGTVADGTIRLTKVDAAGATLLQRSFAVAGVSLRSTGVSVDAAGQVVVTAYRVDGVGADPAPVLAKFDGAGNLLWQDVPVPARGIAYRSVTDGAGNAYVLGSRVATTAAGATVRDITLTKYSPQGVNQWVRTWGAVATGADGIVITPTGQVVVAGSVAGGSESRLAAFDAAGNLLWSAPLASGELPGLAVSSTGDIAAVGSSGLNFLVARFNASFGPAWVRSYPARGYAQRAVFDAQGNLVVNGVTNISTGFQLIYAWMTLKLDAAGNPLWTHTYGSGAFGGDTPTALAVGADGAAYLTGTGRLAQPGGGSVSNNVTIKLGVAGNQAWMASTAATTTGVALKPTADGGVLVMGDNPFFVFSNTPALAVLYRYPQNGLPNVAPVAVASANPSAGPAPLAVQFSSTGSSDADGQIASYAWDFGDGQTSTAANPSHTYALGTYTARLTVTDTLGAASAAAPVVVRANAVVLPIVPTALTLPSASVLGGSSVTARVTVSGTAGATVRLTSNLPAVASVPATVVVPAGATSVSFTVRTVKVKRNTAVTLRAVANGTAVTAVLSVRR